MPKHYRRPCKDSKVASAEAGCRTTPEAWCMNFQRAIRLSPLDSRIFIAHTGLACSYFFAGQYDEALFWAKTALRDGPKHVPALRIAMASHALSGKLVEAKEAYLRAMEIDPNQRIDIRDTPFRRDEDVAKLAQGLRLAGMPE